MNIPSFSVNDILVMKKPHPCGDKRFRVLRVGSDIRVLCLGCNRDMNIPREKLEKKIKQVITDEKN